MIKITREIAMSKQERSNEDRSEGFWIDKELRGVVLVSKPETLKYPAKPYDDNDKPKFTGTFYMPPGHPDYFNIESVIGDMAKVHGDEVLHDSIADKDVKAYFFKNACTDRFYSKLGVSGGDIIKINASENSPPYLFERKKADSKASDEVRDGVEYVGVGDFYPLIMSETLKNGKTIVDLKIGIVMSYFKDKDIFMAYTRLLSVYIKSNLSRSLYNDKESNLEYTVIDETGMLSLKDSSEGGS